MRCDDALDKAADSVTRRLPRDDEADVTAHVAECASCREEFARIAAFYALPIDEDIPAPPPLAPLPPFEGAARFAPRYWAAAAALLAVLGFFAGRHLGVQKSSLRATGDAFEAAPLPTLTVALPEIPREWPERAIQSNVELARDLARWTGKPLLKIFTFPECPRCVRMDQVFSGTDFRDRTDAFIVVIVSFTEEVPAELVRHPTATSPYLMMPAAMISDGEDQIGPIYEIDQAEAIYRFAGGWTASVFAKRALDREVFEDILVQWHAVPDLLERGLYAAALRALARVVEDAAGTTSSFGPEAKAAARALERAVQAQAERIKADLADLERRDAARSRAVDFVRRAEGLPVASEVAALLK